MNYQLKDKKKSCSLHDRQRNKLLFDFEAKPYGKNTSLHRRNCQTITYLIQRERSSSSDIKKSSIWQASHVVMRQ